MRVLRERWEGKRKQASNGNGDEQRCGQERKSMATCSAPRLPALSWYSHARSPIFGFLTLHCIKVPTASDRAGRSLPFAFGFFLAFPHTTPMSQTRPNSESKPLSNPNYQHIFSVALESYKKRTGNDLTSNPLLPRLETCNSPDAVIALLQEQIPGFDQSRSDNNSERMSSWLNPTVNVIVAFSGSIGDSVGPVGLGLFHLTYP